MDIDKIPFKIDFPLKIFNNKKINFGNRREREKIFKRNIYYYKYDEIKNPYLERRSKIFLKLVKSVLKQVRKKYPFLEVLNISVFGSSLYLKNNDDFDFLVITSGNVFSYCKTKLIIKEDIRKIKYSVGISIKGIENFSKGIFDSKSNVSLNIQSQVIYRTVISLFRRHITIIGQDFNNNEKVFLRNIYAQVSDLLNNAYELYYLHRKKTNLDYKNRSRKILSRVYEAISYINLLENDIQTKNLKKKISMQIQKKTTLSKSKKIFDEMVLFYKKKTEFLNRDFNDKRNVLSVLSNRKLRKNIQKRLENYWKYAKLPYKWIKPLLDILSECSFNEDLAIEKIRKKFPQIFDKTSLQYSKKLGEFRKVKVKNLAKRIKKDISGKFIADVGGRTDDFAEQIVLLNKKIKRMFITDLYSFTAKSKNPKIDFVLQSSLTKIPFSEKCLDTIILSMVLHHLNKRQQKEMIKNLISYLKDKGKIILIEDSFPERTDLKRCNKITKDFLNFKLSDKKRILHFYDWFGNRIMRNRKNILIPYSYKTMEEWKRTFEKQGMKQIKAKFIKKNSFYKDIFPPKAILVFQKRVNN